VRGRPRSAEDLAISVWRSWIPSFDNLSKLDQDMSDWLCRLSEGAGLPKRKLYSDTEEVLIEAARPIVLTAIPDIAQSGDVLDRAALVRCEQLQVKVREQVLLDQFEAFRPQLLCYLLEAASCALRRFPEMVDTHDGLRRGDWCAWVEAAAPALGFEGDAFTEAYRTNQTQAVRAALELDTVSAALLKFMERERSFEGTITSLHSTLEPIARKQHSGRLPLDWPSMSHHFSGRLRRLAPMLRRVKVEVEQRHGMAGSLVRVVNKEGMSPHAAAREPRTGASSASSASYRAGDDAHDAHDAAEHNTSAAAQEHEVKSNGATHPNGAAWSGGSEGPVDAGPPPKKSRIRRGVRH
jgi:hypothetical protein